MNHSQLFSSASANFQFVPFTSVARGGDSTNIFSTRTQIFNTEPGSIIDDQDVTQHDVLSDRGKGSASREGNKFYSMVIKEYKDEYQRLKKSKLKRMLVLRVLDIFKNRKPKGRFLKGTGGKKKEWIIQNDTFALKKIAQALREKPKEYLSQNRKIATIVIDSTPNQKAQEESKGSFTRKRWKTTPSSNRKNHHGQKNDYDSNDDDDQDESIATDEIVSTNILDEVYEKPVKRPLTSHQVNQSDRPMPRYLIKLLESATKS